MDPVTGLLAGVAGSFITGAWNSANASATNQFNAEQAGLNRDFQERMSSTAYQRGMADMRAAGLNPILAYQRGGASSPGGSSASGVTPAAPDLGQVGNSAMNAIRLKQELVNMQATEAATRAQEALSRAQAIQSVATAREAEQRVNMNRPGEIASKGVADTYEKNAPVRDARVGADLASGQAGSGSWLSQAIRMLGGMGGIVSGQNLNSAGSSFDARFRGAPRNPIANMYGGS